MTCESWLWAIWKRTQVQNYHRFSKQSWVFGWHEKTPREEWGLAEAGIKALEWNVPDETKRTMREIGRRNHWISPLMCNHEDKSQLWSFAWLPAQICQFKISVRPGKHPVVSSFSLPFWSRKAAEDWQRWLAERKKYQRLCTIVRPSMKLVPAGWESKLHARSDLEFSILYQTKHSGNGIEPVFSM